MKRQIRRGVFETNSSSVHSLTMCSSEEYEKWEEGKVFKEKYGSDFKTREEIVEELKSKTHWKTNELYYSDVDWNDAECVDELISDNEYVTEEEFFDNCDYETFSESYTTPNGDSVIAFGYFGEDR